MNLDLLRYFYETAKCSNMTRAAQKLRISQSAISRAIKKLEDDLGTKLITHSKRHLQFTEAGNLVVDHCQDIFDSVQRMRDSLSDVDGELFGPMRFACSDSLAGSKLISAISKFRDQHPRVTPEIELGGSDLVKKLVNDREVDVGIIVNQGNLANFRRERLFSSEFVLAHSPKLDSKNSLQRLIIARNTKESFSRKFLIDYERVTGKKINPFLLLPSWLVCKSYVLEGAGAAILPRFMIEKELRTGTLKQVKTNVEMGRVELCTITPLGKRVPNNVEALMKFIRSKT